jgi:hypothetical protein
MGNIPECLAVLDIKALPIRFLVVGCEHRKIGQR